MELYHLALALSINCANLNKNKKLYFINRMLLDIHVNEWDWPDESHRPSVKNFDTVALLVKIPAKLNANDVLIQ